jgi:hypothetical protein
MRGIAPIARNTTIVAGPVNAVARIPANAATREAPNVSQPFAVSWYGAKAQPKLEITNGTPSHHNRTSRAFRSILRGGLVGAVRFTCGR